MLDLMMVSPRPDGEATSGMHVTAAHQKDLRLMYVLFKWCLSGVLTQQVRSAALLEYHVQILLQHSGLSSSAAVSGALQAVQALGHHARGTRYRAACMLPS